MNALPPPWKDITSHSQNAKDRAPRTWLRKVGSLRLIVTRHVDFEKDVWVASCSPLFDLQPMKSTDLGEAACQATARLQVGLEELLKEILS